jgi:hypothetical protein
VDKQATSQQKQPYYYQNTPSLDILKEQHAQSQWKEKEPPMLSEKGIHQIKVFQGHSG